MADTATPRLFDDRTRRELLDQRVLVLDGKRRKEAKRAQAIVDARERARRDPERVAADPDAVRAEVALP